MASKKRPSAAQTEPFTFAEIAAYRKASRAASATNLDPELFGWAAVVLHCVLVELRAIFCVPDERSIVMADVGFDKKATGPAALFTFTIGGERRGLVLRLSRAPDKLAIVGADVDAVGGLRLDDYKGIATALTNILIR